MAGRVNADHVRALTYGIKHLGLAVMLELEQALVTVAENKEPGELFEVLKDLKDIKHPEDLDVAHLKGMDKEDFSVAALPDGFHISGFLNAVTNSKLKKGLDSVSALATRTTPAPDHSAASKGSTMCCPRSSGTTFRPTRGSSPTCRSLWTPKRSPQPPSTSPRPLRIPSGHPLPCLTCGPPTSRDSATSGSTC